MNQKTIIETSRQNVHWGSRTGIPDFVHIDSAAESSLLLRTDRRKYVTIAWSLFRLLSANTSNVEIMQVTVCFTSLHCIRMCKDCEDISWYLSISRYLH
jgi:hypothetical protein